MMFVDDSGEDGAGVLVSCGRSGDHQLGFVTRESVSLSFASQKGGQMKDHGAAR